MCHDELQHLQVLHIVTNVWALKFKLCRYGQCNWTKSHWLYTQHSMWNLKLWTGVSMKIYNLLLNTSCKRIALTFFGGRTLLC